MYLKWSDSAFGDLRNILQYYADEVTDGGELGPVVVRRIIVATRLLKQLPYAGRPGQISGTRELVIKNAPYIAFYEVSDDSVEILRVLHTSRLVHVAYYCS